MKKALFVLIGLETCLLAGGAVAYGFGAFDGLRPVVPAARVFRPQIGEARIGDAVRYERRDRTTGRVLGYLDYEVRGVFEPKGTTIGNIVVLYIRETSRGTGEAGTEKETARERLMRIQPRALMHGYLPPRFEDEDDYPAGERPVVSRISTATFALRDSPNKSGKPPPVRGFLVEAVIPRRSVTTVAERYWMTDQVPVFGVARWERGDEVLVLHRMDRPERRG